MYILSFEKTLSLSRTICVSHFTLRFFFFCLIMLLQLTLKMQQILKPIRPLLPLKWKGVDDVIPTPHIFSSCQTYKLDGKGVLCVEAV